VRRLALVLGDQLSFDLPSLQVLDPTTDAVLLAEVYAAGEAPIVAADGRSLARALRVAGKLEPVFVDRIGDMAQAVLDNARPGDVVLCMGAGSIGAVAGQIVELGACSAPC
jgi:UDP-N-acetylmuramate--alanine ligase